MDDRLRLTLLGLVCALSACSASSASPPPGAPSQSDTVAEAPEDLAVVTQKPDAAAPPTKTKSVMPPTAAERARSQPSLGALLDPKRERKGAVSAGTAVRGRLYNGVALPMDGEHHRILEDCRERGTNFGTEELVTLLLDTAEAVHKAYPGPRLATCNMSKHGGGNISWSRSHNAGRDADIAFFMLKDGEPVPPPELTRFGRELLSLGDEGEYTFDVARNWAVIKHLLSHPTVQVQWIFVYKHLRRAMFKHARAIGEPKELMERAELAVWQPSDSSKHHDHFHVRVFCTPLDRAEGCLDDGPMWPWRRFDPEPLADRSAALAVGLMDKASATRTKTLDLVEKVQAFDAAPGLAHLAIFDPHHEVRLRALNILVEWHERDTDVIYALETFIRAPGGGLQTDDPSFTVGEAQIPWDGVITRYTIGTGHTRDLNLLNRAWRVLAKMASPHAGPFLSRALKSKRVLEGGMPEARLAGRAAQNSMDVRLVPALFDALTHENPKVRISASISLRRITNHSMGVSWGPTIKTASLEKNADRWRAWWVDNNDKTRDELLLQGFRRRGVRMSDLESKWYVEKLVPLTKRKDELGYNADLVLKRITGRFTPLGMSVEARHEKWSAWYPKK